MLQDIAILTGGQVICDELGLELKDATMEMLGRARQVKVDKENTVIVEGAGDSKEIAARISSSASRSRTRRPITTVRSCRSGWPSWPAAWR